jgi:hypothetical protein
MATMMGLSFWMYWESPHKSWTANIGVTAGVMNAAIILLGVIAANIRYSTFTLVFDKVQAWCLTGGGGIVVFWFLTDQPLVSYVLVQCIALVAYFATVKRLWSAEHSTEPYFLWVVVLLANLCAIYPALVRDDLFSWIYLGRALPSVLFVIYLIARIKRRMRAAELAPAGAE